ncbi:TlpA family protein disulfide reductase [Niabella aquatica]
MKKTTLLGVMAGLCLYVNVAAQSYSNFHIGQRLEDINLGKFLRYKQSTANLSEFSNKLIILSFWFRHCGSCIKMFPKEDSLQQAYGDRLQIIPVTQEYKNDVEDFLNSWEKRNDRKLILPYIVEDSILTNRFPNATYPYYIWINGDGYVMAFTSSSMLTKEFISLALEAMHKRVANRKKIH